MVYYICVNKLKTITMKTRLYITFSTLIVVLILTVSFIPKANAVCNVPNGLATTNITTNSAKFSWNSTGAQGYNVSYRPVGLLNWITLNTNATFVQVNGLVPNVQYEWRVRSVCATISTNIGTITRSAWSTSLTFTTLAAVPCPVPSGLSVTSAGATTASLSWNSTGSAGYNVRYKPVNALAWQYKPSQTNSVTLLGLIPSTNYVWQVQSLCGTATNIGGLSTFSTPGGFTTTQLRLAYNQTYSTISITADQEINEATLTIIDMNGAIVCRKEIRVSSDFSAVELPFLAKGLYAFNITGGSESISQKIFVE
jgi:hypothetical protein